MGYIAHQTPLSREFSGKSTGVSCHFILQGIFPTQGSNPGLLHWQTVYHRATRETCVYLWRIFLHWPESSTWVGQSSFNFCSVWNFCQALVLFFLYKKNLTWKEKPGLSSVSDSTGLHPRAQEPVFPRGPFGSTLLMALPPAPRWGRSVGSPDSTPAGWWPDAERSPPWASLPFYSVSVHGSSRIFRGLIEQRFAGARTGPVVYKNRGYYCLWWLISNYQLYKGGTNQDVHYCHLCKLRRQHLGKKISCLSLFLFFFCL